MLARKLSDVEHEMATLEEGSQELGSLLSEHERLQRV